MHITQGTHSALPHAGLRGLIRTPSPTVTLKDQNHFLEHLTQSRRPEFAFRFLMNKTLAVKLWIGYLKISVSFSARRNHDSCLFWGEVLITTMISLTIFVLHDA